MGVWDTVCSVGVLWSPALPFINSNTDIKTFRHALSLDEHRTKFRPNYYHRTPPRSAQHDQKASSSVGVSSSNPSATLHSEQGQSNEKKNKRFGFVGNNSTAQSIQLKQHLSSDAMETGEPDIKEVWFAGCHSDIGGGAVCNDVEQSLSNISLRWMVREIIASGLGAIRRFRSCSGKNQLGSRANYSRDRDGFDRRFGYTS